MDKIQTLKAMLDSTEDEEVLTAYLELAGQKIINARYPYAENRYELSVPYEYEPLQVEIAAYMLNKRGAEGETQHIENGIHRNYGSADIPAELIGRVIPYVGVVGG